MSSLRNANSKPLEGYASLNDEMDDYVRAVLTVMGYKNPDLDNLGLSQTTVIAVCERADWWRRMRADHGETAPEGVTPYMIRSFYEWFGFKYEGIPAPSNTAGILRHWPDFEVDFVAPRRGGGRILTYAELVAAGIINEEPRPDVRVTQGMTIDEIIEYGKRMLRGGTYGDL